MNPSERQNLSASSILGLGIAFGFPVLVAIVWGQTRYDASAVTNISVDIGIIVAEWLAVIAVLAIMVFWERRSPADAAASIGFRQPQLLDAVAVLIVFVLFAADVWVSRSAAAREEAQFAAVLAVPLVLRMALVLTAGLCEEVLFRGMPSSGFRR